MESVARLQVNLVSCKAKRVAFVNVTIEETDALWETKADVSTKLNIRIKMKIKASVSHYNLLPIS